MTRAPAVTGPATAPHWTRNGTLERQGPMITLKRRKAAISVDIGIKKIRGNL